MIKSKLKNRNISQEDESSPVKEIGNLSTTYSTWNYFPPQNDTNVSPTIGTTKSSSSFDTTQLRIDAAPVPAASTSSTVGRTIDIGDGWPRLITEKPIAFDFGGHVDEWGRPRGQWAARA